MQLKHPYFASASEITTLQRYTNMLIIIIIIIIIILLLLLLLLLLYHIHCL